VANHASAIKRARQNDKRRNQNRSARAATRTQVRSAGEAIAAAVESGDAAAAQKALQSATSVLARAATKGVIPKKRAARKTSRLAKQSAKI
jgi:small subunit ribosomal protein S20